MFSLCDTPVPWKMGTEKICQAPYFLFIHRLWRASSRVDCIFRHFFVDCNYSPSYGNAAAYFKLLMANPEHMSILAIKSSYNSSLECSNGYATMLHVHLTRFVDFFSQSKAILINQPYKTVLHVTLATTSVFKGWKRVIAKAGLRSSDSSVFSYLPYNKIKTRLEVVSKGNHVFNAPV